jgi:Uri superfamily endonuclease
LSEMLLESILMHRRSLSAGNTGGQGDGESGARSSRVRVTATPHDPFLDTPGTYVLVLHLDQERSITCGAAGLRVFRAGDYLYVGSALRGLGSRLRRHFRTEKSLHWHIDYLTRVARIAEVWYVPGSVRRECAWAQAICGWLGEDSAVAGFGASDCSCCSHLFFVRGHPDVALFERALGLRFSPDVP